MAHGDGGGFELAASVLIWVSLLVAPLVAPRLVRVLRRRGEAVAERRRRRRPVVAPTGALVDGLRRLSRELALLPAGTPYARARGTQIAYDSLLVKLCAELDIDCHLGDLHPGWQRDLERLRVEDRVHAMGLRIRTTGP